MKKQYFAKYLPVEGEIKQGNKYFAYDGTLCERYASQTVDGDRLAKLFLCNRDIQVGDKVRASMFIDVGWGKLNPGDKGHDVHRMFDLQKELIIKSEQSDKYGNPDWWVTENGTIILKSCTYKFIGEISPEAVWVEEGDEFTEEEIYLQPKERKDDWWRRTYIPYEHQDSIDRRWERYKAIAEKVVLVKNPHCKHFH